MNNLIGIDPKRIAGVLIQSEVLDRGYKYIEEVKLFDITIISEGISVSDFPHNRKINLRNLPKSHYLKHKLVYRKAKIQLNMVDGDCSCFYFDSLESAMSTWKEFVSKRPEVNKFIFMNSIPHGEPIVLDFTDLNAMANMAKFRYPNSDKS